MLIGGGQLYRWGLPRAQRLYLTLIDVEVEGDARCPDWSENDWRECSREDGVSEAGLAFSWRIYQRDDLAGGRDRPGTQGGGWGKVLPSVLADTDILNFWGDRVGVSCE